MRNGNRGLPGSSMRLNVPTHQHCETKKVATDQTNIDYEIAFDRPLTKLRLVRLVKRKTRALIFLTRDTLLSLDAIQELMNPTRFHTPMLCCSRVQSSHHLFAPCFHFILTLLTSCFSQSSHSSFPFPLHSQTCFNNSTLSLLINVPSKVVYFSSPNSSLPPSISKDDK